MTAAKVPRAWVPGAFDAAARGYDLLVGANPGYHRHLRMSALRARTGPGSGLRILDLGCGTGASTAALLAVAPAAQIVGVDASAGMLARARAKTWPDNVRFVHASAGQLAEADMDAPFDVIFAAYLVRNLDDPDRALRRLRGMLRPGGQLVVHEYSVRDSWWHRLVWTVVCWSVIVPLGTVVARDPRLFVYLWRSVLSFDGVQTFRNRLFGCGFDPVDVSPVTGWQRGIVHTFVACQPQPEVTR
ncbi:ubiquinone/menaquinone biosynthesis methyltransferase [Longimycelium tulufanense]|uniref:Ubiquinone/menaquinone biosynthesis methyltransferase n=1 Tax=Longimycelium tulufanense TaxID=907463 RepID=A0A8J3FWJ7_9PSEU|nr:class I SAM-dependent methyltransferase [Longimycelium tulufanense]GGM60305.1 ubiquinone/menaquinone biosynthesis methyltransferase [Longimycelium tulufanense]